MALNFVDECIEKIENQLKSQRNVSLGLWGAGLYGQYCIEWLQKESYKIEFIIDTDPRKIGKKILGVPIISPSNVPSDFSGLLLITARHKVNEIMRATSFARMLPFDSWFIVKNVERFKKIYALLADQRSREVLENIMRAMITGDITSLGDVSEVNQYFIFPSFISDEAIFVDAGAYCGDTIEKFIWFQTGAVKKIYAFEPSEKPFCALQFRRERLLREWSIKDEDFILFNYAVGAESTECTFDYTAGLLEGHISKNSGGENNQKVSMVSLDDVLGNTPVTLIKADIEGAELEMLRGAQKIISKFRPNMVLSAYHRLDDIYTLVDCIMEIIPEYKFSIRHHSPKLTETVLYCTCN